MLIPLEVDLSGQWGTLWGAVKSAIPSNNPASARYSVGVGCTE